MNRSIIYTIICKTRWGQYYNNRLHKRARLPWFRKSRNRGNTAGQETAPGHPPGEISLSNYCVTYVGETIRKRWITKSKLILKTATNRFMYSQQTKYKTCGLYEIMKLNY